MNARCLAGGAVALAAMAACVWAGVSAPHATAQVAPFRGLPPTGTFALSGTTWTVEQADGRAVLPARYPHQPPPTLRFPRDGGVVLQGCNQYVTSLTSSGPTLTFSEGARSLVGCAPEADNQDERLETALLATRTYRHESGILLLLDEQGHVRLRARRQMP